MAYSIVDQIPRQACPFPQTAEAALYDTLLVITPDNLLPELVGIYVLTGGDSTQAMMDFAYQNKIELDCPVCGGAKVRQCWVTIGGELELQETPCYCYKAAL